METLNNAAHAAGFAMAASDDPHQTVRTEVTPEAAQWRPGEAVLRQQPPRPGRVGDWARSLFSLFGRRAPASPA